MDTPEKTVDGFRFLPPALAAWIRRYHIPPDAFAGEIPWTPMAAPLNRSVFALVTSAGISLKTDPPFDMEREKREPLGVTARSERSRGRPRPGTSTSTTCTSTPATSSRISTSCFRWRAWRNSSRKG